MATMDRMSATCHPAAMINSVLSTFVAVVILSGVACEFSGNNRVLAASFCPSLCGIHSRKGKYGQSWLAATVSEGAGSWRAKAKFPAGYQISDQDGDNSDRVLNISFVTGNAMKKKEINTILASHGAITSDGKSFVKLRILDVDLPEIQEMNTEAIAKHKAIQAAQLAGGACVVEDTSLELNALGGMPGPFIKWFQDKLGSDGLFKILTGYDDKSAVAVCTLAFCPYPHADPVLFTGRCTGKIVEPVTGKGFSWDSIFVPDGETEPFSCMSTEKKCQMSHRSKAVVQWADWLEQNIDELWERQHGRPAVGHKGLDFKPSSFEQ